MTTPLPLHIDSTMISAFRSCPQKYLLEFAEGLRPQQPSIDLHAGSMYALALETAYKEFHTGGRSLSDALAIAEVTFHEAWGDFEIPPWKKTAKTRDRMWEAVESYFAKYPPRTDHVQPFFNPDGTPTFEFTFAIPLEPAVPYDPKQPDFKDYFPLHPSGDPFLYCGRFDMLGTYNDLPCVKDDKTSGSNPATDSNWSAKWNLRSQFIGYTWACQQSGIPLDTVIVRGVGILKTKIEHAEAIKVYSNDLRMRWLDQVRRDLWRLVTMAYNEEFDYNFADACTAYGNCLFMDVCQSAQPEQWKTQFVVRHWNPLDKNPDAPLNSLVSV